jgi:hypothetical protein
MNNLLDAMNFTTDNTPANRQQVTDTLARLQAQGLLKYTILGIDENGEDILSIEMTDKAMGIVKDIDF